MPIPSLFEPSSSYEDTDLKELFFSIFRAQTEEELHTLIEGNPLLSNPQNWFPLGGNENNFAIVQNQQSKPIAAMVEKITNSIDAILMKRCLEEGIKPDSPQAPQSMEEAVKWFFPNQQWDLQTFRRKQAEEIQIIADGPKRDTAVIIYDNGEGQHPEKFEDTFLSLVRGNKINYHFVQGKYNMGGSGAIVFCGERRYQLIASKRFDGKGNFGFTLIRQNYYKHEQQTRRASKFEFLKINGNIPSFPIDTLELKLYKRQFKTGTIIKLYSYQFPSGYSAFSQDLNQSLNEFLFEPTLPILTTDNKERYPNNTVLVTDLFGLKRRLSEEKEDYIEDSFSETYSDPFFGTAKVMCYVFKAKRDGRTVKETDDDIDRRYFKNNMSVLFSINGQVHGYFTSEFITRTLKFNMLKKHLLIHVDCTDMELSFREELFMASRDRLKEGNKSGELRDFLGSKLQKSRLKEINHRRKETIGLESTSTTELIKSLAKNLPKDGDLMKLIQNTLKLEEAKKKAAAHTGGSHKEHKQHKEEESFHPQHYPTFFKVSKNKAEGITVIALPLGGEKNVKFDTDVENQYFDRTEHPGKLEIGIVRVKRKERTGGDAPGKSKEIANLLAITESSPHNGTIRLTLGASNDLQVGDEVEVKIALSTFDEPLEELLLVKVVEPEQPKEKTPQKEESLELEGLPDCKELRQNDWDNVNFPMNHSVVMFPQASGDILEVIYVNLDSHVFLNYRSKVKNEEQIEVAKRRYVTSVYFHVLFLYLITKRRGYGLTIMKGGQGTEVTIDEYLQDVFSSHYTEFLLNFGSEQLMGVLGE